MVLVLHTKNLQLVNTLLDDSLEDETLARWYPILQTAIGIDERRCKPSDAFA